ncbi:MAG: hypothetical protein ACHQRM_17945, partial [Bacteroidia bacterium]
VLTLISFLLYSSSAILSAQGSGEDDEDGPRVPIHSPYRMSVRGEGLIPHPISNGAFRRSFNGVYDATLSVNFEIYKGFNVGLMGKNSGFQTPPNKIARLNTKEQYNAGGIRFSYDYFITKMAVFSSAFNFGQCYIHAYDIIPVTSAANVNPYSQGSYFEPELAVSFLTETDFSIGFNLSYELINTTFNPYALALEQHNITYSQGDLTGSTSNLSFGFHFVYYFWKKKKK